VSKAGLSASRVIKDVVCPECGCLCDDLEVVIEDDQIRSTKGACAFGRDRFDEACTTPVLPAKIFESIATLEAAIDRAAERLLNAKAPVVWGLADSSIEAQRVAVAIADRLGALVSVGGSNSVALHAFQRLGTIGASFGEIKDRADLIVYDAATPRTVPDCFPSRFGENAVGRFLAGGRDDRSVIWLGSTLNEHAGLADHRLDLSVNNQAAFYSALRAIVQEIELDRSRVESTTGFTFEALQDLAKRLKAARYGAFVINPADARNSEYQAKLALIRTLNQYTRFVIVHIQNRYSNRAGAEAVLSWQTGVANDVDFSMGSPRYLPMEGVRERVKRGEVDAALILSSDDEPFLEHPHISRILIHSSHEIKRFGLVPNESTHWSAPEVMIGTAQLGIGEGGSLMRSDGVMLPLRPVLPDPQRSKVAVLKALEARLIERSEGRI
jgi:formylmethanofuran dehydrogenase subunit B